jgi:APA family basic amino acid/polyamine antiporter
MTGLRSEGSNVELKRALGLFDATAISIGAIIGAGIYVVTGVVAGLAGPSLILSIVLAGAIASFSALSFAELSAYMPKEGGGYEFTYNLLSPYAGFLSGWMWVFSNIFIGGAVSLGFAQYLVAIFPFLEEGVLGIAAVFCLSFTMLNLMGVRESATVNNVLVVAKIIALAFFVVFGLGFINVTNYTPFAPRGYQGMLQGASLIFFAYGGYARVTTVAEEVKDPSRTIPKAILFALALSTIFYLFVSFVAVGIVNWQTLQASQSPLADAISVTGNSAAVLVVSLGAMISTASVLLMTILGVSRMTFAMARNGQLPRLLSKIHPRFQTPYAAILITGLLSAALVFGGFSRIVAVGTFSLLFHHALVNLSASRLKPENRRYPVFVSAIGFVLCLSLLFFLSQDAWIIGIAGLLVGSLYYVLTKRIGRVSRLT